MKKVKVDLKDRSYSILIGKGALSSLPGELKKIIATRRVLLVSSKPIFKLFGSKIVKNLKTKGFAISVHSVPDGEAAKSETSLFKIYEAALKAGLDRTSGIIALGGGAVGDVVGFAASTYLRGVAFVNIPTTLLAQVDSAIGGKTAINLKAGKNLVGTFYQPRLVISDLELIRSLPKREFVSSLAEIIKYGVISSSGLFKFLEKNVSKILRRDPKALERIISESSLIKAKVVEMDERELTGLRAILNFGHTFAHAYEKAAGYGTLLHGEAVAIGMCEAARLAQSKMLLSLKDRLRIEHLIQNFGLPISVRGLNLKKSIVLSAMLRDKKKQGDKVRFILPRKIGATVPVSIAPQELF